MRRFILCLAILFIVGITANVFSQTNVDFSKKNFPDKKKELNFSNWSRGDSGLWSTDRGFFNLHYSRLNYYISHFQYRPKKSTAKATRVIQPRSSSGSSVADNSVMPRRPTKRSPTIGGSRPSPSSPTLSPTRTTASRSSAGSFIRLTRTDTKKPPSPLTFSVSSFYVAMFFGFWKLILTFSVNFFNSTFQSSLVFWLKKRRIQKKTQSVLNYSIIFEKADLEMLISI